MFLSSIIRAFKFALQDFWRNIWLSLSTISIIILTLISINVMIILSVLTNNTIRLVEDRVDVSVYFKPTVRATQIQDVQSYLLTLPQVKDAVYISKEEALKSFQDKHQNNEEILSSLQELGENPLGAVLVIKARQTADYPIIMRVLEDPQYDKFIEDKDFVDHQAIIQRINDITNRVYQIGVTLSMIFIFIVMAIVFNTIKMAIYTHRKEITIMRLVGANKWFIRAPYLLEGVIYSVLACAIAIMVFYPLLGVIQGYLGGFFLDSSFNLVNYVNTHFVAIFGFELLAMIFLNVISASWATRKYLQV